MTHHARLTRSRRPSGHRPKIAASATPGGHEPDGAQTAGNRDRRGWQAEARAPVRNASAR